MISVILGQCREQTEQKKDKKMHHDSKKNCTFAC